MLSNCTHFVCMYFDSINMLEHLHAFCLHVVYKHYLAIKMHLYLYYTCNLQVTCKLIATKIFVRDGKHKNVKYIYIYIYNMYIYVLFYNYSYALVAYFKIIN